MTNDKADGMKKYMYMSLPCHINMTWIQIAQQETVKKRDDRHFMQIPCTDCQTKKQFWTYKQKKSKVIIVRASEK